MNQNIEFRPAPHRSIWSDLVKVADDARLLRLMEKAQRMMRSARNAASAEASLPCSETDWSDFSAVVKNEENRRIVTH
jgi:hypothetical protein